MEINIRLPEPVLPVPPIVEVSKTILRERLTPASVV